MTGSAAAAILMHSLAGWPDWAEKVSIAMGRSSRRNTASRTLSRYSRRSTAVDEMKTRRTGRVATFESVPLVWTSVAADQLQDYKAPKRASRKPRLAQDSTAPPSPHPAFGTGRVERL